MWMNEYDVDESERRWAASGNQVMIAATQTMANLVDVVNCNSDGWPYWQKPARAAKSLMALIMGDGTWNARYGTREDATPEALKAAYKPLKAFRTRTGLDFEIVEIV